MGVPQQVVIVGAGIGGVSTAAALRSGGFSGEITLLTMRSTRSTGRL